MISTLLLFLDTFFVEIFITISLKHANSLKIVNFLFDMDTRWPFDMLRLDYSMG